MILRIDAGAKNVAGKIWPTVPHQLAGLLDMVKKETKLYESLYFCLLEGGGGGGVIWISLDNTKYTEGVLVL